MGAFLQLRLAVVLVLTGSTAFLALSASTTLAADSTVTIVRTGSGTGTVSANAGTIACGATCTGSYTDGTMLTLTAAPGASQQFTGWLGPCTGTGGCSFTVNGAASVVATFAAPPVGTPRLDIDGSTNCDALTDGLLAIRNMLGVTGNALVSGGLGQNATRMTATDVGNFLADVHPAFDIDGNGKADPLTDGVLILRYLFGVTGNELIAGAVRDGATRATASAIATYAASLCAPLPSFALSVMKTGSGTGTVAANGGISCGATCQAGYIANTGVTLTAAPGANSTFDGWSGGGCSGTAPCTVMMDAARSVTASFGASQFVLTVMTAGTGTGTVTSVPAGINCGMTCAAPFNPGTMVTLTASAASGSAATLSDFKGWSGDCSGTGQCVVSMSAAHAVTAIFDLRPNIAFVTSQSVNGNMGGLAGADTFCKTAAAAAALPGNYRAFLSTAAVSAVSRLGSASGWIRPDGKPVADTAGDLANGRLRYPLRLNQNGADVGQVAVTTASTMGGVFSGGDCASFTSTLGSVVHGSADGQGLLLLYTSTMSCATPSPLYCIGIDRAAAVQVAPPPAHRMAFTTAASWSPGGGIANADNLCQTEAAAATLPGTYKALLATSSVAAGSRFNTAGAPWARADGVLLKATASNMFSTTLWDAAPGISADGTQVYGNTGIWGGSASLSATGTSATTCQDWSNGAAAVTAVGGRAGYSYVPALVGSDSADPCNSSFIHLVCFQD
ncbi:MAG: hypothetical protein ABI748_12385 [Dokdonella sp.]